MLGQQMRHGGVVAALHSKIKDVERGSEMHEIGVAVTGVGVELLIDGFGTNGMMAGFGAPVFLEIKDGKPTLYVWADITKEDPTHTIDLSGAKEPR